MAPLWQLGAPVLSAGFRRGDFSPVDATRSCLERIAQVQPRLNAFVHLDAPGALAQAADSAARWSAGRPIGALDGIPLSLKDNLHAQGWPTTWGSESLRGFIAAADEAPVARVRATGAVLLGKTNLPEFAMQGVTDNALHGATRNPWDVALTPGGSSGGAAAAVAAGCGPLALVTDGGGSTRRPASHCGLVGFKPSGGLVPRGGGLPEIFGAYEVPGVIARDVDGAALLLEAVAGGPLRAEVGAPLRILAIGSFGANPVDPGIAGCVRTAVAQWRALGHTVTDLQRFDGAEAVNALWPALSGVGLAWMLAQDLPPHLADVGRWTPASRAALEASRAASPSALQELQAHIDTLAAELDRLFAGHDLLLTPATAALPWPIGQTHPAAIDRQPVGPRGHAVFTAFANACGLPAVALPAGMVGGLPTGFQLVARQGADALLLAAARAWEQAHPWTDMRPSDAT